MLFAEEWTQSFKDAFGCTAEVDEALALNKLDVQSVSTAPILQ